MLKLGLVTAAIAMLVQQASIVKIATVVPVDEGISSILLLLSKDKYTKNSAIIKIWEKDVSSLKNFLDFEIINNSTIVK